MGTIAEKLTYLNTTKTMLRDSLNKFGSSILSTDTFRSYDTKLNEIYDKLPKVTQNGAGFTLFDVQNGQVDDFKMIGTDMEQNTNTGINKFYLNNNYSTNYNEASIEVNNNNSFILRMNKTSSNSQSPCATIEFNASYLKPNTTYTISKKNSNTGYVLDHVGSIRLYTNGSYGSFIDAEKYTFTTPNQITSFRILLYLFFNNSITGNYEITFYDIQLEENSTATDFEPYTGGIPIPNPNYPQDIKVVDGRQVITNSGKNLFDINSGININNLIDAGITSVFNEDGTIKVNGEKTANYKYIRYSVTLPAGTYYFCGCPSGGSNNSYSSLVQLTQDTSSQIFDTGNGATFTLIEQTTIQYFPVRVGNDNLTFNNTIFKPMISTTPITYNDYEPYYNPVSYNIDLNLENIYLVKMPNTNYKNRIYKNNGNWYYEKNVEKVVLDGSENWETTSSIPNTSRFYFFSDILNSRDSDDNNIYIIADKFKGISWKDIYSDDTTTKNAISNYNNSSNISGRIYIRIDNNYASTTNELKTWLSTHNVIVWYELQNPVTTQITNSTLINQLEAISVHTGTNIFTISNDNNIIPELEITRLKELEKLA